MKKLWQEIKLYINTDWHTDEQKKRQKNAVRTACAVFVLICTVMSLINWVGESYFMMATTASLAVSFLLLFLVLKYKNSEKAFHACAVFLVLLVTVIFTYYLLTGGEQGFSPIWILLVPSAAFLLLGNTYGLVTGIYFLIAVFVCFWSPEKELLPYEFDATYLRRFPVVYFSSLVLALVTSHRIFVYEYNRVKQQGELEKAVREEHEKVEQLTIQVIQSICNTVDARDSYTKQHSIRVAKYSSEIARRLGWSEKQINNLYNAAVLHDIGKIGVADDVLKKHGGLTAEEYEEMKKHVVIGGEILKDITTIDKVAEGAKYHHERFDGRGYACGLKGEEIPIEARIIGIADAVDAMYSTRIYRGKQDISYIAHEVREGRGTQFDDKLANIMLEMIEDGFLEVVNENRDN